MTDTPSFWDFSLAFYADPATSEACLELQDHYGVDVNVLLFLLWCSKRQRGLSDAELRQVTDAIAPWRDHVVRPLRAVRRFLKELQSDSSGPEIAQFRIRVKSSELEAERLQQVKLESGFVTAGSPLSDAKKAAVQNLRLYQNILSVAFPSQVEAILLSRLDQIMPLK